LPDQLHGIKADLIQVQLLIVLHFFCNKLFNRSGVKSEIDLQCSCRP